MTQKGPQNSKKNEGRRDGKAMGNQGRREKMMMGKELNKGMGSTRGITEMRKRLRTEQQ